MYYKAISNGNADTLAIWNVWNGAAWVAAGSLPSTSDDVYTNNFIVTVTTSQSYKSWNRSSVVSPAITQGGQFRIDGANEITIQGTHNGGNVNLGSVINTSACINRLVTHTNTIHVIGDSNGGTANFQVGFWNGSAYDIDLVGNQNGGTGGVNSHGFYNANNATFTSIIGNQNGGVSSSHASYGFANFAASTFTSIVGNQNGGTSNTANYGFFNNGGAIFSSPIIGTQIAFVAPAFYNNVASLIIPFQGNAYASGVSAIFNNQDATTTIIYEGNLYNNLSVMAIRSGRLFLNVTPTTVWEFSDFDGDTQYLYGAGVNTGHPLEADVRKDTVYGPNDEFEGTLAVPPPESVVKNVPVDDTVGTWAFDAELITRLQQCSTVEITGAQIASYNT